MIHTPHLDAPSLCLRPIPPVALAACVLIAATTLLAVPVSAAPASKVEVCHIPPGNPANFHTIVISENALAAHLAHGDVAGPCNNVCATLCDDGNRCTIDDTGDCEENGCPVDPAPVDCNDGNACTADSCDPAAGCEYVALTGTSCSVPTPSTCEKNTGVCDGAGACEPDRIDGCCLFTSECEAWDINLCTHEECIDTTCVTTSAVACETDACHTSTCIEATGECSAPEEIVCDEPQCHYNGCDPESGCYSNPIEGCCVSDLECDDANNCTTDICLGIDGCATRPCASGDACNVLIDCDPSTCAPQTVPQTCEDDADLCTAESCADGLGCVSSPVACDLGETCDPNTGDCACFTAVDCAGSPDIDACHARCEAVAGCPGTVCDNFYNPQFADTVNQCINHGVIAACEAIDAFGRDPAQGNCTSVCPLPEPEAPDLLVCGGGCWLHNSDTGNELGVFTQLGPEGCGDPGLYPVLFRVTDGTFWMFRLRNLLSDTIARVCVYDETASTLLATYELPQLGISYQHPEFDIRDWTVTHLGHVYATVHGTVPRQHSWYMTDSGTVPAIADNKPGCGGTPNAILAAPADPSDPAREYAYAVSKYFDGVENTTRLIKLDFSDSPPTNWAGNADPMCATEAIVGDGDPLTDNMSLTIGDQIHRLRLAADGSIYMLAWHGNPYGGTDEGIWRLSPTGFLEQIIAMCDLLPQPCSSTPIEKPIIDFAIHPLNGNLYVLERDNSPYQRKLEVYDPAGTSLGVLHQWTDQRHSLEFFPTN